MFVILLKFSTHKALASQHMEGHKAWLQQGFDDGVFLLSGSLPPGAGGGILAQGNDLPALQARVAQDPFVLHDIVRAEITEISPSRTDARLAFLQP